MALLTTKARTTKPKTDPTTTPSTSSTREPHTGPLSGDTVVEVRGHHRSFDGTTVLRGVDLRLCRGELVALLGRSGSGKSTLLRSLAGLDPTPVDEVQVRGRIGVAFQEPRLLPWRSTLANVKLPLVAARSRAADSRAHEALVEVGLEHRVDAWPLSLSGGEAQRASLARALVQEPDLLLLDEPFGALDALTRREMHYLVTQLWRRHQPALLLVTHDVDEALTLADRVLVLADGRISSQWQIRIPREDRAPDRPEIASLRRQVLHALGVRPDYSLNRGAA